MRLVFVAAATLVLATPASAQVERVTIAGRVVDDPGAFRDLLDRGEPAEPAPAEAKHVSIVVEPSGFAGAQRIEYFPLEEVARRDGEWLAVEDDLAERIEDELAEQAGAGRPLWPAYLSLFALLGTAATLLWLRWGQRRWRARGT